MEQGEEGGTKIRMEREKEESFPQKQFIKNEQSSKILLFIYLKKMFWTSCVSLVMDTVHFSSGSEV